MAQGTDEKLDVRGAAKTLGRICCCWRVVAAYRACRDGDFAAAIFASLGIHVGVGWGDFLWVEMAFLVAGTLGGGACGLAILGLSFCVAGDGCGRVSGRGAACAASGLAMDLGIGENFGRDFAFVLLCAVRAGTVAACARLGGIAGTNSGAAFRE